MRRFGEPLDPSRTYRDRPGAYGVILDDRDALVTEQLHPAPNSSCPAAASTPAKAR